MFAWLILIAAGDGLRELLNSYILVSEIQEAKGSIKELTFRRVNTVQCSRKGLLNNEPD